MVQNIPELMMDINPQLQEVWRTPSKISFQTKRQTNKINLRILCSNCRQREHIEGSLRGETLDLQWTLRVK